MVERVDRCKGYQTITITFEGNGHGHQVIKTFDCRIRTDAPYCNGYSATCPKYESIEEPVKR